MPIVYRARASAFSLGRRAGVPLCATVLLEMLPFHAALTAFVGAGLLRVERGFQMADGARRFFRREFVVEGLAAVYQHLEHFLVGRAVVDRGEHADCLTGCW